MAIPDYQTLMLPLLRILGGRQDRTISDLVETLAAEFKLSPQERGELLPSGRQPVFENRVGWARTYMKKAGFLESPRRGWIRITSRGLEVLKTNPGRIDVRLLSQYPEFREFQKAAPKEEIVERIGEGVGTPEEVLEADYQVLRKSLARELLDQIRKSSPRRFEQIVVDLLLAMGYGRSRKDAGQVVGGTGDEGIDGIISQDKLGLDSVYVQAKRWKQSVGRPEVQAFAGSLGGRKATKGVIITTSEFTREARDFSERTDKRIVLIDGERLADLMIEHGIGVSPVAAYEVKRIDSDYLFGE